jgi:hypothetical protein
MSENNTGWFKRVLGGDSSTVELQGKLASLLVDLEKAGETLQAEQERCRLKGVEVETLKERLLESGGDAARVKQELQDTQPVMAGLREELRSERARAEADRTTFERSRKEAGEAAERARLQVEAEKLKAKSAYSQIQGLEKRVEGLQEQAAGREKELVELRAQLSAANERLRTIPSLEAELKAKADELLRAKLEWTGQRQGLDSTLSKQRAQRDEDVRQIATLQGRVTAAEEKTRALEEAVNLERQGGVSLRSETERLRKGHEQALREERMRWLQLVNRFWRALENSLGAGAFLSLAGALDAQGYFAPGDPISSPEKASQGVSEALSSLSPGSEVSVSSTEDGVELRVRRAIEGAAGEGTYGEGVTWLGVYAVQCLGSMLGQGLRASSIGRSGGDLIVRARYRDVGPMRSPAAAPAPV